MFTLILFSEKRDENIIKENLEYLWMKYKLSGGEFMAYYFICFVVTWILMAIYFIKWKNTYNTFVTLSYIAVAITNFGYWQLAMAQNVREAIMAQYFAYTGSAFIEHGNVDLLKKEIGIDTDSIYDRIVSVWKS